MRASKSPSDAGVIVAKTGHSNWQMRWVREPKLALREGGRVESGEILLDVPTRTVTIASDADPSENLTRLKRALDAIAEQDGRVVQLCSAPEAQIIPMPDGEIPLLPDDPEGGD